MTAHHENTGVNDKWLCKSLYGNDLRLRLVPGTRRDLPSRRNSICPYSYR